MPDYDTPEDMGRDFKENVKRRFNQLYDESYVNKGWQGLKQAYTTANNAALSGLDSIKAMLASKPAPQDIELKPDPPEVRRRQRALYAQMLQQMKAKGPQK